MGGEFAFIGAIRARTGSGTSTPAPTVGMGDDCAVWTPSPGYDQLVSTDLLIEGVHFSLDTTSLADLGHKALAVNLSDMAAMGGTPRYVTVGLGCPRAPMTYRPLMNALIDLANAHGVALVGGDTCASPEILTLSVTILGEVPTGTSVTRCGARPGDLICVTGAPGESAAGLAVLTGDTPLPLPNTHRATLINRHLRPAARLAEGQLVREQGLASSMIDVSDGLTADLSHILDESGAGALLEADRVPISAALAAYGTAARTDSLALALGGGEDYELLFTVPEARQEDLTVLIRNGELAATVIGRVTPGPGMMLMRDGTTVPLSPSGYEHFG